MYTIDYDRMTMHGTGTDESGRTIKVRLTWAFAPDLTAYNLTDGVVMSRSEWTIR